MRSVLQLIPGSGVVEVVMTLPWTPSSPDSGRRYPQVTSRNVRRLGATVWTDAARAL
jgi:hypothetical protein